MDTIDRPDTQEQEDPNDLTKKTVPELLAHGLALEGEGPLSVRMIAGAAQSVGALAELMERAQPGAGLEAETLQPCLELLERRFWVGLELLRRESLG